MKSRDVEDFHDTVDDHRIGVCEGYRGSTFVALGRVEIETSRGFRLYSGMGHFSWGMGLLDWVWGF